MFSSPICHSSRGGGEASSSPTYSEAILLVQSTHTKDCKYQYVKLPVTSSRLPTNSVTSL